jgi:predicted transcriptional regulator
MKIKLIKRRRPSDIEDLFRSWEKKYGSLVSLHQKVLISKCTSPEQMNDYVMWKNLSQGAEFQDIVIMNNSDVFEIMSPKRMEMLEYLIANEVSSIKALAGALHRNYKNVYDDLKAMSKYELVDLTEHGRSLKPSAAACKIEIGLDT